MIIRKQPLVKLLELADQVYLKNSAPVGRGRPFTYSEQVMFKCFVVKTLKRLDDCSGLYHYLSHEANITIRTAVGLAEKLPNLKTFQRRFAECGPVMRRQLNAVAQHLHKLGVISFEMLAVDGSMCEALGPDWHQSDKAYAHIPPKLRNLDVSAEWGKSGYHGWVYGYKSMALCNCAPGEPTVFVDGWLLKANACETVSLREQLQKHPLPRGNRLLLGDSGFDDKQLFELCQTQASLLITPISTQAGSALARLQKEALYLEYVNCGLYKQRSLSIEPLWAYLKARFALEVLPQHGLFKNESAVVSAMAVYNLIVLYNHSEGLPLRAVKPFLDVV